jgi:ABC-type transporter Mla subunit MlaD
MGSNIVDALGRLKGTLDNFNTVFSDNIGNINNIVVSLAANMQTIAEGMGTQKQILNELYSSKFQDLIKVNTETFNRVEKILPEMDDFIRKQKDLNELMANSTQFVTSMHKLLDRVSTFENSVNVLGETINESQLLGSRQLNLVQRHLDDLDKKQSLIENYTNQSNEMVEEYLKANVKHVRSLVDNFETAIRNAFEITNNDSPFQKLTKLDTISEEIKRLNETLASYTKKEEDLINVVSNISNDVKSIRSETIFSDDVDNDAEG